MERRKKEEAEYRAKQDEIAERQRKREQEMEEKERERRDHEILGKSAATVAPPPVATGKYVPKFKRMAAAEGAAAPPLETEKWRDDRRRPAFGGGAGGPRSTWNSM